MADFTRGVAQPPSAAHLVKLIGRTPEETAKLILEFQSKNYSIRTWEAVQYLRRYLQGDDIEFLKRQAGKAKNKHMGRAALETLPLIEAYREQHKIDWFQPLPDHPVVLAPSITIRIKPIGVACVDGKVMVLAGQVWKNVALNAHSFRVWATILKAGILDNNPDIEGFHWLEMSAPTKGSERELNVRTLDAIDLLSDKEFADVVTNLRGAMEIVRNTPRPTREKRPDPRQDDLF